MSNRDRPFALPWRNAMHRHLPPEVDHPRPVAKSLFEAIERFALAERADVDGDVRPAGDGAANSVEVEVSESARRARMREIFCRGDTPVAVNVPSLDQPANRGIERATR